MRKSKIITMDEVIFEWFKSEVYNMTPENRTRYQDLTGNFDSQDKTKNQSRIEILTIENPNLVNTLINPLYRLSHPLTWYEARVETPDEYKSLHTCCSEEWHNIAGDSFQLKNTLGNLDSDTSRKKNILDKKGLISQNGKFSEKIIMIGSSENQLTIIDGCHRAIAYLLWGEDNNFDFLPLNVIIGVSSAVSEYPFSFEYISHPQ